MDAVFGEIRHPNYAHLTSNHADTLRMCGVKPQVGVGTTFSAIQRISALRGLKVCLWTMPNCFGTFPAFSRQLYEIREEAAADVASVAYLIVHLLVDAYKDTGKQPVRVR